MQLHPKARPHYSGKGLKRRAAGVPVIST